MLYYDPLQLKQTIEELNVIPSNVLDEVFKKSQETRQPFHRELLRNNLVSPAHLGQTLADLTQIPYARLNQVVIPTDVLQLLPEDVAKAQQVITFKVDDHALHVAMENPAELQIKNFLVKKTGKAVIPYIAFESEIQDILFHYSRNFNQDFETQILERAKKAITSKEAEPPIIELMESILQHAQRNKASDIHIEPLDSHTIIRFRIDGVMQTIVELPKALHERVITRIKVMASMRIDEHHEPQDGKIESQVDGKQVDVRVSVVPITGGEKAVLRLLSEQVSEYSLEELGLSAEQLDTIHRAYAKPYGMILSTGPTGSGKTTTLYAILKLLNQPTVNIMTIEDPVEYDLAHVNQIQVNTETGLSFADGLRTIVRQDPDIILVGEIRDPETADISTNAAMTGHIVLSSLHTNDAATTFPRLKDLSIEPYLIASTVSLIIAQRLVRKICPNCHTSVRFSTKEAAKNPQLQGLKELKNMVPKEIWKNYFSETSTQLYQGKGCELCHQTGYMGRVGVFEVMEVSESIRQAITDHQDASKIKTIARQQGMVTMLEDGLQKVSQGITTIEEVLRVSKM